MLEIQHFLFQFAFSGSSSIVRRVIHNFSKQEFAVKIIDKFDIKNGRNAILSEISILKEVNHPNIIKLVEIFESQQRIFIVMEL